MIYEDRFGWGGPNHIMTDIQPKTKDDLWKELTTWEDQTQTVVFITVCPEDVRRYYDYDEDMFKDITDDEIYDELRYVARKIDFGEDYGIIMDWVREKLLDDEKD